MSFLSAIQNYLVKQHYQPELSLPLKLLLPTSWGYGLVMAIRQWLYESNHKTSASVDVPIISVGNITTGGTGKTPVVLALAKYFFESGFKVVILSRGYGATEPLEYGQPTNAQHGDEPWLIQSLLPEAVVIVGANRSQNALKAARDHQPDVIILDDGFQHLKLQRALDLVLIDGEQGLGNGQPLPIGPLREPVDHLDRADIIAISKTANPMLQTRLERQFNQTVETIAFNPTGCQHWFSRDFLTLGQLQSQSCLAFSGIGQPAGFGNQLRQSGLDVIEHIVFDDHHDYNFDDIERIKTQWGQASTTPTKPLIITTEKDRVKVKPLLPKTLWPYVYSFIVEPDIPGGLMNDIMATLQLKPLKTEKVATSAG